MAEVNELCHRNLQINICITERRNYGLTSQIRRSSISIPSNIAEGSGKNGDNDYLRFLNIAISSLFEIQTQLEVSYNLKFINENQFNQIHKVSKEIERMLSTFIRKIKDRK
ncbi:four helix bundle protein [Flavobacterium cheongpyeongense]|nr:four helix bundle protein [Flavobacterium cheongpyeongense]